MRSRELFTPLQDAAQQHFEGVLAAREVRVLGGVACKEVDLKALAIAIASVMNKSYGANLEPACTKLADVYDKGAELVDGWKESWLVMYSAAHDPVGKLYRRQSKDRQASAMTGAAGPNGTRGRVGLLWRAPAVGIKNFGKVGASFGDMGANIRGWNGYATTNALEDAIAIQREGGVIDLVSLAKDAYAPQKGGSEQDSTLRVPTYVLRGESGSHSDPLSCPDKVAAEYALRADILREFGPDPDREVANLAHPLEADLV